jgi:glycosyltransferase involved in cell wall biosynthesis
MKIKILYIHQYFQTPEEGGKTRSYEIAKQLAQKGHEVTMLTSWNKKHKKQTVIEGINVIYLPVSYKNKYSFIRRILSFKQFELKSIATGRTLPKPDIIFATSTPLNIGIVGDKLAKHFKCPWVFEIRDLWPEAPIRLGIINSKLLQNHLYKLESQLLKSANKIIALSPFSVTYIDKITDNKPVLIPNFCNNDFFQLPKSNEKEIGTFRIGYFGAISTANGLNKLLELAKYAQDHMLHQYEFILVGEGKSKQSIVRESKGLHNITFFPEQNKIEIAKTILTCQASYISFVDSSIMQSCSPNKFFDSLASGRLIVTNTIGWIAELIEAKSCGFYATSPEEFFSKISPYQISKALLTTAQENAKNLALSDFDKTNLVNQVEELLMEQVSNKHNSNHTL